MFNVRLERVLAVIGATCLLILGFDTVTYGATGSSLILGSINKAGKPTTINNTSNLAGSAGSALALTVTNPAAPPLTTNSKAQVPNLYASRAGAADTLQGKTPAQVAALANRDAVYHEFPDTTLNGVGYVGTMNLPKGRWALSLWADAEYQVDPAGSNYTMQSVKDGNNGLWVSPALSAYAVLFPKTSTLTCGVIVGTGSTLTYGVPVTVEPAVLDITDATIGQLNLNRPLSSVNNGGTPLSGPSTWFPVAITQAVTIGVPQSLATFTQPVTVKCDTSDIPADTLIGGYLHLRGARITAVPISGDFTSGN